MSHHLHNWFWATTRRGLWREFHQRMFYWIQKNSQWRVCGILSYSFGLWGPRSRRVQDCLWIPMWNQVKVKEFCNSLFHVKKQTITYEGKSSCSVVFLTKKGLLECKPEWNREAVTVFSRLPSLRRLQATPPLQTSLGETISLVFCMIEGIYCKKNWFWYYIFWPLQKSKGSIYQEKCGLKFGVFWISRLYRKHAHSFQKHGLKKSEIPQNYRERWLLKLHGPGGT